MQSPENWFEDFGSAKLENGRVTVSIDPRFAQIVNTGVDYHVFLTPKGDCRGLYVANRLRTASMSASWAAEQLMLRLTTASSPSAPAMRQNAWPMPPAKCVS